MTRFRISSTSIRRALAHTVAASTIASALAACDRAPTESSPPAASATAAPTNRVDINASVRQNLGITFARAEMRSVSRTLRVPGRFELLPTARRDYRAPVEGQVQLLVEQYQPVEAGTPLYRIESPAWRELQREISDAQAQVALAQAAADSVGPFMEAHERHHAEIQAAIDIWVERVAKLEALEAAGGASGEDTAQARASLAAARSDLAETLEKEAELVARSSEVHAQVDAARGRLGIAMQSAALMTGRTIAELNDAGSGSPVWRAIDAIEVRAHAPGVVDSLSAVSGAYVEQHALVLTSVQPDRVRFRAHALQSDLGRLTQGLPAMVVAPRGGSLGSAESVAGTLALAPTADPERRTIELVMTPTSAASTPAWARAGVSGFLEVLLQGDAEPQLAIPLACVVRDGTQSIIFRRDPRDREKAIRMEADLGLDDGRWIVVKSGIAEGDEVVLDGVYQLMVATSGSITKGGHFHPDGTFHEGTD